MDRRRERRTTFDQAAELYDAARPRYPEALFDDLVDLAGVGPGDCVLDIGCGTGQASVPLARRALRLVCVELGENLAALARRNLAPYPGCDVHVGAFEDWPAEAGAYDLAVSATAFHWIDPAIGYPKTARALRPGGALAVWWSEHVRGDADQGFFDAVQTVYRREMPPMAEAWDGLPRPEAVGDRAAEIRASGRFAEPTLRRYLWDVTYDAASYTRVLRTYSDHRSLDPDRRERLLGGIADLIDTRFDGRIVKTYLAVLHVALRR